MSVEIKLEKHPQSDGEIMYSAMVFQDNTPIYPTSVAKADRAECLAECRAKYEALQSGEFDPEWIALEA